MIDMPDFINGMYELLGAPFIFLSVLNLHRTKKVSGVSWVHAGFFASWGYWNLFYYPHLNQWLSFIGGCAIVVVNSIWLAQLIYYRNR